MVSVFRTEHTEICTNDEHLKITNLIEIPTVLQEELKNLGVGVINDKNSSHIICCFEDVKFYEK